MQFIAFLCLAAAIVAAAYGQQCTEDVCSRPDCVCASDKAPIEDLPQLVMLTFDDSVTKDLYDNIYKPLLDGRKNPDGEPISATFYVPHSYTNYQSINEMYNIGYEIAVHSITKNPQTGYWLNATKDDLIAEFGGQRTILSTYANIPAAAIVGARVPNFAINGNVTHDALKDSGLTHDNSWPTLAAFPYFPYTLDHPSPQQCVVATCPTAPFPGFWEVPIVNFVSPAGNPCNVLYACMPEGTENEVYDWLKIQFENTYVDGNKAPLNYLINSVFLGATNSNSTLAFTRFLTYLDSLPDVFLVSTSQAIEWQRNPVSASNYSTAQTVEPASCNPVTCALDYESEDGIIETRYMGSCVPCPPKYPWLGNPLGEDIVVAKKKKHF